MRKVKLHRCEYDYVEVMACPSGACFLSFSDVLSLLMGGVARNALAEMQTACMQNLASCLSMRHSKATSAPYAAGCLNGGGQMKPAAGQSAAQMIEQLEAMYEADSSSRASPDADAAVGQLYREWVGGPPGSAAARQLLHTQYHRREKTVTATLSDW